MISVKHTRYYAAFYVTCFVLNYAWYLYHGLTFSQIDPVFFYNKADITGNLLMATGLQHTIIENNSTRLVMDTLFLALPASLAIYVWFRGRGNLLLALTVSAFSMLYAWFFSITSFVSIEGFFSWMIVPLAFAGRTEKDNYYLRGCTRIIFIIVFFSTALWKIRAGGVFNPEQMSAILLQQHVDLLSIGSGWYFGFINWLVSNPGYAFALYIVAFAVEFAFIIGFFTRRYDRLLLLLFCLFILLNYFLMSINYFSWLALAGVLLHPTLETRRDDIEKYRVSNLKTFR